MNSGDAGHLDMPKRGSKEPTSSEKVKVLELRKQQQQKLNAEVAKI